jgi:hypothetical protein
MYSPREVSNAIGHFFDRLDLLQTEPTHSGVRHRFRFWLAE